jgi:hypothetical protein
LRSARRPAIARLVRFYRRQLFKPIVETQRLPHSAAAGAKVALLTTGDRVVVRKPRHLDEAMRRHLTHYLLAYEARVGHLVLPAGIGPYRENQRRMFVEYAGDEWKSGRDAPLRWFKRVPDSDRVMAALIDLLSSQDDRIDKNVIVRRDGGLRLVDQDRIAIRLPSVFFPGAVLGYASKQDRFSDLPGRAQLLVEFISRSLLRNLERWYRLPTEEAGELRYAARDIRLNGLTRAIERRLLECARCVDFEKEAEAMPTVLVPMYSPSRWLTPALTL